MLFFKRILTVLLILFSLHAGAQGFLHAREKMIVNGNNEEVMLRGMGLGGWMLQEPYMLRMNGLAGTQHEIKARIEQLTGKENTAKFYQAWLSNYLTKADIDSLASWGFNSVRLPMHYNLFTLPVDQEKDSLKNTWLTQGFALTDSLLQWCKANHIYLILDLHAAPGGQGNDNAIADRDGSKPSLWQSRANRQKTIALWKKLAQRYANEEWIGGYDLINETNWGFQDAGDKNGCNEKLNADLKALLTDITKGIRSVDRHHLIFIEGNCWANNYNGMFPLWDDNMAVSFHKYWNHNDTAAIGKFLRIREEQRVPLWMGESGENSNAWFTDAISLLEQNHIGWAWWPVKKLGSNNPSQIKAPEGYQKLLAQWRGNQSGLSAKEGNDILMELATASRIENNTVHHDVVDAMFRQVRSQEAVPYRSHVLNSDLIVYASDYDLGRNGTAYQDKTAANYWVSDQKRVNWNEGGQYRNDGVDIGTCTDSLSNGYSVGWTEDGEWLQYSVMASAAGPYNINVRVKGGKEPSRFSVTAGEGSAAPVDVPANAEWTTFMARPIQLQQGMNRIRINILKGGLDLSYLYISSGNKTTWQPRSASVYTTAAQTDNRITSTGTVQFSDFTQPLETQPCVFVDPSHSFQTMLGIGGALTDASAETFAKLPKAKQQEFLKAYYDPVNGIGYTLARTNIQSCDFSSGSYSYVSDNDKGLNSFSIEHDRTYRIPFIKQAIAAAGGKLLLYASPWSPPAWMKDNNSVLQGGKLLPAYRQSWADFYVRFIRAYEKEGIPIWGISVQNEPMAKQKWESCIYTAEDERDFIKQYLGPTLKKEGLDSKKLIAWDHNRDLLYHRASTILEDPEAAKYVWGIGYHWYETWTGSAMQFDNVKQVAQSFPSTHLIFTEGCVEKFKLEQVSDWSLGEKYGFSMINDFNSGAAGWTDWNVLLDEKGGPNHVGNFCFAPVIADTRNGSLIYTNSYYYIGHFSKFIHPGAKRVASATNRDKLLATAFMNADGKLAVVVMNASAEKISYKLCIGTRAAETESLPHSITTLIID